ncbi:chondroitin AC/alginate lyase [Mycena crocata]|nr:chondroitin AC/alginate lyase [Mycena crocata]
MPFSSHALITLLVFASSTIADPTDWVNSNYVLKQQSAAGRSSSTKDAQNAICQSASSSAAKGPWSVTNSKGAVPPSGDYHDYLSWAPYHWPNCNWCTTSNGRVHLVHDGNSTTDPGPSSGGDDNYEDEAVRNPEKASDISSVHLRMSRQRRRPADAVQAPLGSLPVDPFSSPQLHVPPRTTTGAAVAGTSAPPQAAAKSPSCTPSPTKPMPASATWTTCPYVVRDGKVNPDVRTLNGPSAINAASQSILDNAVCCALQGTTADACCQNVLRFIDAFFLTPATRMSPNMNFGQIVRGPGSSSKQGTFTGLVDMRGVVKVVNGISMIKAAGIPDWKSRDKVMGDWFENYTSWLTSSELGKSTADKANNHATFYVCQLTAVKIAIGDTKGAINVLKTFVKNQFQNQIAASGEQPFESVRTRPFHYRCFNMEALITAAKLGDQLGIDLWTARSRYGASIKDALDFTMGVDPKDEDVTVIIPHVAAVAAAYGDPTGKYDAFIRRNMPGYQKKSFWFYDQSDALTNAPAVQRKQKRVDGESTAGVIPFECPPTELLPNGKQGYQLDDDIFVTCNQLRPSYESLGVTRIS